MHSDLPLKSNIAYVRVDDGLFYINKETEEFCEIKLQPGKLKLFDQAVELNTLINIHYKGDDGRIKYKLLTQEQLQAITKNTGHVAIKEEQPIYFKVCPAREFMAQKKWYDPCFGDEQIENLENMYNNMKFSTYSSENSKN